MPPPRHRHRLASEDVWGAMGHSEGEPCPTGTRPSLHVPGIVLCGPEPAPMEWFSGEHVVLMHNLAVQSKLFEKNPDQENG